MFEFEIRTLPVIEEDRVAHLRYMAKIAQELDAGIEVKTSVDIQERFTRAQEDFLLDIEGIDDDGTIRLKSYQFRASGGVDEEEEIAQLLLGYVSRQKLQCISFKDGEEYIYGYYFCYGNIYSDYQIMNDISIAAKVLYCAGYSKDMSAVEVFQRGVRVRGEL